MGVLLLPDTPGRWLTVIASIPIMAVSVGTHYLTAAA